MAISSDIIGKWRFRTPCNSEHFEANVDVTLTFRDAAHLLIEVAGIEQTHSEQMQAIAD